MTAPRSPLAECLFGSATPRHRQGCALRHDARGGTQRSTRVRGGVRGWGGEEG